jgi:hypothetical protein
MPALFSARAARAGSPRRWATGAAIAATLLAEIPRAPDRTPDRVTAGAADPHAACERPAAGGPHRSPPAPRAPLAAWPGGAGASPRPALRHVIGL